MARSVSRLIQRSSFCASLLLPLMDVAAQELSSIELGTRVRVTAPSFGPARIIGEFAAVDLDTLKLQEKGLATPSAIPLGSITKFEVRRSRGGSPRMVGEFFAGGVGGVATGLTVLSVGQVICRGVDECGVAGIIAKVAAAFLSFPLGNAMGVYTIGSLGNKSGSFRATLGGSTLGFVAGTGAVLMGDGDLWALGLAGSTIGATTGFNPPFPI